MLRQVSPYLQAAAILSLTVFSIFWFSGRTNSRHWLLRKAGAALEARDFADAERFARQLLREDPSSRTGLAILGEALEFRQQAEESELAWLRIDTQQPDDEEAVLALFQAATRGRRDGRLDVMESSLRRVLEKHPQHPEALMQMVVLLHTQGRIWEAASMSLKHLQTGRCRLDEMMALGAFETTMIRDSELYENCLKRAPEDASVLLGDVRLATIENRKDDVRRLLEKLIVAHPRLWGAQAQWGLLLSEQRQRDAFFKWVKKLPPEADQHPDIWHARGMQAVRDQQFEAAVRCFLEALRLHPNHLGANYQISQALARIGQKERAQAFADRSEKLAKIGYFISELKGVTDFSIIRQIADLMEGLGRYWEAAGWRHAALDLKKWNVEEAPWAREGLARIRSRIHQDHRWVAADHQPALRIDLEEFPLPDGRTSGATETPNSPELAKACRVRFQDVAEAAGLQFDYYNGTTSETGLQHMLQSTGGGVAVLDYDQDGWPDLYFAQSGPWKYPPAPQTNYRDRLFRNQGDGTFADVTEAAGLGAGDYSQGVAVGDINQDGWPDLYLANVGPNRLYLNMGDGTFEEATQEAGVGDPRWSLSAAIADMNHDGAPEIYVVNYLILDEVATRICKISNSDTTMGCSPSMFTAEQDRLYFSRGDGSFEDVTEASGVKASYGKGLGVIAADFAERGRIDLFVGNDTTANFFFVNQSPTDRLAFREEGVLTGVAYNEAGHSQSCMGLAVADADGNGMLDLFATNFYNDHNTLYLQRKDGSFYDASRESGLYDPSFYQLGFGSQFLDGELDGWPDLALVNGHVDRTAATGNPDLMPPQYFQNVGRGRFVEIASEQLGPYFEGRYLGRALAVVDWNRDGKEDLCVSHLDARGALLSNQTEGAGHYLAVELRGVQSARDAVGAIVKVQAGGRTRVRHLLAGDGYMVSNEKLLIFGLGEEEDVEKLTIRWPSGKLQEFADLQADRRILVIEGREEVFVQSF